LATSCATCVRGHGIGRFSQTGIIDIHETHRGILINARLYFWYWSKTRSETASIFSGKKNTQPGNRGEQQERN